jgi:hypothetical protein
MLNEINNNNDFINNYELYTIENNLTILSYILKSLTIRGKYKPHADKYNELLRNLLLLNDNCEWNNENSELKLNELKLKCSKCFETVVKNFKFTFYFILSFFFFFIKDFIIYCSKRRQL